MPRSKPMRLGTTYCLLLGYESGKEESGEGTSGLGKQRGHGDGQADRQLVESVPLQFEIKKAPRFIGCMYHP